MIRPEIAPGPELRVELRTLSATALVPEFATASMIRPATALVLALAEAPRSLLSAINAYYGPGRDVSEKAEAENKDVIGRFLWLTSETGGVSSGVLEYDVHDDSTTFSIRYSELDALRKAEDKEAAKSGADF